MNDQAYSTRDLQHCQGILQEALADGVTEVLPLISLLSTIIEQRFQPAPLSQAAGVGVCPECGITMRPLVVDGLQIMACKVCRYSEVVK